MTESALLSKPRFMVGDLWANEFSGRIFEIVEERRGALDPKHPTDIQEGSIFPYRLLECEPRAPHLHKVVDGKTYSPGWVNAYGMFSNPMGDWSNVESEIDLTKYLGNRREAKFQRADG